MSRFRSLFPLLTHRVQRLSSINVFVLLFALEAEMAKSKADEVGVMFNLQRDVYCVICILPERNQQSDCPPTGLGGGAK